MDNINTSILSDSRVQMMLDTAPIAVGFLDKQLNYIDCNMELIKMFGLSRKKDYLRNVFELMPPFQPNGRASIRLMKEYLQQAIDTGRVQFEFIRQRMDGRLIPTETTFVRVEMQDDDYIVAYTRDLTEIKKATTQAKRASESAHAMLDSMPIACFLVRADVTAIDCNQAALDLFGFENKKEAIRRYRETFPMFRPDGTPTKIVPLDSLFERKEPFRMEYMHQHVDGTPIPCHVTLICQELDGIPVMAVYLQDLREIKTMTEEIRRIEVAEKESRAKSQFLARMSHEIRTPMNVIKGITDIHLYNNKNLPQEIEDGFMQIRSSSDVLLALISDILDLSKIGAGKINTVNKPYATASLIHDVIKSNTVHMGEKDIRFVLYVDENLPATLIGDELRIKQILSNMLSNAFKYTQRGMITLSFSAENTGHLTVSVKDTGQGMTEEQIGQILSGQSEYLRFNEEANQNIQGTGIGMTIVTQLVALMGGEIEIDSEPDMGTTISVALPQIPEGSAIIGREIASNLENFQMSHAAFRERNEFEYEPMPYGKVMIVDDVESNLHVAEGLMHAYELDITLVTSGEEALALVNRGEVYDIIFMDHMMGGMDGIATARAIFETGYDQPIIALTANTVIGKAQLFMENGFAAFISKPIDIRAINRQLVRFIKNKYPEKAAEQARRKEQIAALPAAKQEARFSPALVASLIRDANRILDTLANLHDKSTWTIDDYKLFTINAHAMKSVSANVYQDALRKTAEILEDAGRKMDMPTIRASLADFMASIKSLVCILIECNTESANTSGDINFLRRQLTVIHESCKLYTKKDARNALAEIMQYTWEVDTMTLIDTIAAKLQHSEFDEISDLIDDYLSR